MKKVAIIGAGSMSKPLVDYFIDRCGYQVVMVNRTVSKAEAVINGRPLGKAVGWASGDPEVLDTAIGESDIVISMVPKPVHLDVAESCLRCGKSMLTTSYEIPELLELDQQFKEKGLMLLNELGEVPGIDHFGTQLVLGQVRADGGTVISLKSYGSGLPAFSNNNNPMFYKFSWDPGTVFVAAKTSAAYYQKGKRIEVSGDRLFEHFWLEDIEGLGTFETYPNKDCKKYLKPFGLHENKELTFYRGLLRFSGYCNTFRNLNELGLMNSEGKKVYEGKTYRQFMASLIGTQSTETLEQDIESYLKVHDNADIIHRLKWLGILDDRPVDIKEGSPLDVLLDRMLKKMSYSPGERDMIILHIEVIAEFPDSHREKRLATMVVEGDPGGDSAMSRAVALPAAIAARLILEGKVRATGCVMPPTLPELYGPALDELKEFGYAFKHQTVRII
ncbi:MAG: saccharopine dehydrogenase [bacterium]|nr:saccharopine dehydrogenase [bacterium]